MIPTYKVSILGYIYFIRELAQISTPHEVIIRSNYVTTLSVYYQNRKYKRATAHP